MRYLRAYQFIFDSPNWLSNVLLGLLCQMIPAIGPIVGLGYQYEMVEELHLSQGSRYPDFTFNRFVVYLTRGIWPFIVQMIVTMPLVFVLLFFWFGCIGLLAATADGQGGGTIVPIVLLVMFVLFVLVIALITFLMMPLALWAGLAQDFKPAAMWAFMKEFLSLVFKEMVLVQLFGMATGTGLMMVGLLLCFVGIYPAMMLVMYAHAYLVYELYELHLERGGSEIKLKIEEGTRPS